MAATHSSTPCRAVCILALLILLCLPAPMPASADPAPAALTDGPGFDPAADDSVYRIVVQPDGMILVAGPFTTINGQEHKGIARLYPDGSLDPTFTTRVSNIVRAVLLQPDGKIIIGGDFSAVNGQPRNNLARLNADGSLDETFTTGTDEVVFSLLWQTENTFLVGGSFTQLGGKPYLGLGRLDLNGSVDESFHSLPFDTDNMQVFTITRQPDSRLLIGGYFQKTVGEDVLYSNIERLSADGVLDETFNVDSDNQVTSILVQGDKIIIGGAFYMVNAQTKPGLARLNTDGTLDDSFTADTGWVFNLLEQPDGKILVTGSLYTINGVSRDGIARLNADGSLDTDFDPNQNCPVELGSQSIYGIALQPNGRIVIGGLFDTFGCQPRGNLARLFPDGSLDHTRAMIYLPMIVQKGQ